MSEPLKDEQIVMAMIWLWQVGLPEWANGSIEIFIATIMDWDEDRSHNAFLAAWQAGYIKHIPSPDEKIM